VAIEAKETAAAAAADTADMVAGCNDTAAAAAVDADIPGSD
jgi:hypothetical protein